MAASVLTDEPEVFNKGNLDKQAEFKRQFGGVDETTAQIALGAIGVVLTLSIAGIIVLRKSKRKRKSDLVVNDDD